MPYFYHLLSQSSNDSCDNVYHETSHRFYLIACKYNEIQEIYICTTHEDDSRPKTRSIGVGARRPLPADGRANVFRGTTRIGAHCYAAVLVTMVHCFTVES
jgi:hypothetical protein